MNHGNGRHGRMRLRTFTYTKQRIRTPPVRNSPMKRTSRTCMRLQQAHVAHICVLYTYRYGPYPVRNSRFLVFIRIRPEGYPSDTSVCATELLLSRQTGFVAALSVILKKTFLAASCPFRASRARNSVGPSPQVRTRGVREEGGLGSDARG